MRSRPRPVRTSPKPSKSVCWKGKPSSIALNLQRNEAELEIKQHQRAFGTQERSHLSVSGYVDSAKALARPPARDALHLRVFKTRLSTVLTRCRRVRRSR